MDIPENVFDLDLEFEAIARTKTAAENINANIAALCVSMNVYKEDEQSCRDHQFYS